MYRKIHFINKDFVIRPYNTQEELDLLEYLVCTDDKSETSLEFIADEFLKYHVRNYDKSIPSIYKILLLYKIREITIGDEISVRFKCLKCKTMNEATITLPSILMDVTKTSEFIKHRIYSCDEFNNLDFEEICDDNVDFDEYEKIIDSIADYFTIYNSSYSCKCDKCQHDNKLNMFTFEKALFFISDENFDTLSACIRNIMSYTRCTRSDVLHMSPMQRFLELKIIKDNVNSSSINTNDIQNKLDPLMELRH